MDSGHGNLQISILDYPVLWIDELNETNIWYTKTFPWLRARIFLFPSDFTFNFYVSIE